MPTKVEFYRKIGRRYVPAHSYEFPTSPANGVFLVTRDGGNSGFTQVLCLGEIPDCVDVKKLAAVVPLHKTISDTLMRSNLDYVSTNDRARAIVKALATAWHEHDQK